MIDFLKGKVTPKDWLVNFGVVAVAVMLGGIYWVAIHSGQQESIAQLEVQVAEVKKNLQAAREVEKNIAQLREEALKWEQLVNSFEERLPEAREIPALLLKFESMGNQVGLRVELQQLPTLTDERKETIPYKVTARGDFHQIASFINLLERDKRYLKITDLDMGEEEANISETSFTLSTFRFFQKQAPAAEPAAAAQGATK